MGPKEVLPPKAGMWESTAASGGRTPHISRPSRKVEKPLK